MYLMVPDVAPMGMVPKSRSTSVTGVNCRTASAAVPVTTTDALWPLTVLVTSMVVEKMPSVVVNICTPIAHEAPAASAPQSGVAGLSRKAPTPAPVCVPKSRKATVMVALAAPTF